MGNSCCVDRDEEYIHWKQQLEATCNNQKDNMCWAEPILIQLKDHRTSNKYQKQLHNFAESYTDNSIENRKQYSNTKRRTLDRNIDTIIRRTGMAEEDLIQNYIRPFGASFNCSMVSTPSYIFHEKTSNVQESLVTFEDHLSFFVSITDQIKEHLEQPNELGIMIKKFRIVVQQKYQQSTFAELHDQLTYFCRTLYETMVSYYDLITLKKKYQNISVLLNEDTLLNFIVNYVMNNEQLYSLLFTTILKEQKQIIEQTEIILKKNQNITVSEIEIPQDFQLSTLSEPYKEAIEILKKITQKKGPSSKVKLIILLAQKVQATIRLVNCTRGTSLLMQSDDLIPILKYIIIKAQIYDINAQLTYIEKLITNGMLNSSSGYYVITMQAALSSMIDNQFKKQ